MADKKIKKFLIIYPGDAYGATAVKVPFVTLVLSAVKLNVPVMFGDVAVTTMVPLVARETDELLELNAALPSDVLIS